MANHSATDKKSAGDGAGDGDDLRGKLLKRLGVAAVLVSVLLGVLAFFDYLSSSPEEEEVPVHTRPVPVAPKKEVTQPVTPAASVTEPPAAAAPTEAAQPAVAPSIPAEVPAAAPALPARSLPAAPATSHRAVPAAPVREESAPAQTAVVKETPAVAAPVARAVEPVQRPSPPAPPRLFSGFVLQAGVFSNAQRAEELHAQLTLNGIPSTIEARVQVGPFKTQEEAEAARSKMKALGIDAILVPPKGARR